MNGNVSQLLSSALISVEIFLTRSLGLGTGELGPDGLGDILGHQGVLGLDLRERVRHV